MIHRAFAYLGAGLEPCTDREARGWLALTLAVAAVPALVAAYHYFTLAEYVSSGDARQFVFWMQRFVDPELYPDDLIADYFRSVSPPGYVAVFRAAAALGIEPLVTAKLLVVPLNLAAGLFAFRLAMRLLPRPALAFLCAGLVLLSIWPATSSGVPRNFAFPLLLAFLDALARGSLRGVVLSIGVLGLFYPQVTVLCVAVLGVRLLRWVGLRPELALERQRLTLAALGAATALVVLTPFVFSSSAYGPVRSRAEAVSMPIFQEEGRARFFITPVWKHWVFGSRAGFAPRWVSWEKAMRKRGEWLAIPAGVALVGLFWLPPLLVRRARRGGSGAPGPEVELLLSLSIAAMALWGLAHLLLFQLHNPSRYTFYGLQTAFPVALGLWGAPLAIRAAERWPFRVRMLVPVLALAAAFGVALGCTRNYRFSAHPALYAYLAGEPKDTLVAGLTRELDYVPLFGRRSVLVAGEHALPYSVGYFEAFEERAVAMVRARFSPEPEALRSLVDDYGVDLLLLDARDAPEHPESRWWSWSFPEATGEARAWRAAGAPPFVERNAEACTRFASGPLRVVGARCLLEGEPAPGPRQRAPGSA